MALTTTARTVCRSRAAMSLAGAALLVLLAVQSAFLVPAAMSAHRADIDELERGERARVAAALLYVGASDVDDPGALLSDALVSLRIVSVADGESTGGSSRFDVDSRPRAGALGFDIDTGEGAGRGVDWYLVTANGPARATGWLDLNAVHGDSVALALRFAAFAVLVSIAGATAALWGAWRCYLRPLGELVTTLRTSRDVRDGESPKAIGITGPSDLNPLAEEFNGLIEAQRKASRQIKVKQQYLEFAAHHDPLTHLPNRLMFEDTLKSTVREAERERLRFAVFLVDLDNFKFFNDQYGHLIGDKMLAEVGNRLRTLMNDIDLVARLDGDEFVVIQKDVVDRRSAERVAARLMSVATAPYEYRGFTLKTAVSVGISCFPLDVHSGQDEEMLGEEIVNNAAVALQEAKGNGKNQLQLFDESMRSRLTARIRLEQDLKIAMQEGQFEVWYQPKVNIHTRQVIGSEALVRWRHPVNGLISPEIFVPVAEEAGMIIELGEWILRTACLETQQLQEKGHAGLNVAVNISAVQFTDGNLLPMVSRALADTTLSPGCLELEITESAVMHDPEEVIHSLHELSRFGMRLAIDDFGTGYSSLAYLKRFPVDTLKIDRAFITDISSDNDDVAIVEAVLGLGKHFDMKVVAEGVEDEEQLQFLKSQGCDIAQGYFISRPMPLEQYADWLTRWPYGVQAAAPGTSAGANGRAGAPGGEATNVLPMIAPRRAKG